MKAAFLVAAGGALGSVARWVLAQLLDRWLPNELFPPGILVVNALGCLLIGVVLGVTAKGQPLAGNEARLLLATGVCGGFTTFSTFSHQTLTLIAAGRVGAAVTYVTLSIGLGLGATVLGLWAVRLG